MPVETNIQQLTVQQIASLGFAYGKVGQRYPLTTDADRSGFAQECAERTAPITKPNTADCGDDRLTIELADGTVGRPALDARVVHKLFGGIGLSATKAAVAANAAYLRDVDNMWDAYVLTSERLSETPVRRLDDSLLLGPNGETLYWEDGGHAHCGASKNVQSSVEHELSSEVILPAVGLLVADNGSNAAFLAKNQAAKRKRLDNGFYDTWSNADHEAYLRQNFPQNYSILQGDPNDPDGIDGHNGSGLYVITNELMGYVKTGRGFSVSLPLTQILARDLGGSDEERRRILLGFADDTLRVGGGIVTEGFPVFVPAA